MKWAYYEGVLRRSGEESEKGGGGYDEGMKEGLRIRIKRRMRMIHGRMRTGGEEANWEDG